MGISYDRLNGLLSRAHNKLYPAGSSLAGINTLWRALTILLVIAIVSAFLFWKDSSIDRKNATRATVVAERILKHAVMEIKGRGSDRNILFPEKIQWFDSEAGDGPFLKRVGLYDYGAEKAIRVEVEWKNLLTRNKVVALESIKNGSEKLAELKYGRKFIAGFSEPLNGSFLSVDNGKDSSNNSTSGGYSVGGSEK